MRTCSVAAWLQRSAVRDRSGDHLSNRFYSLTGYKPARSSILKPGGATQVGSARVIEQRSHHSSTISFAQLLFTAKMPTLSHDETLHVFYYYAVGLVRRSPDAGVS